MVDQADLSTCTTGVCSIDGDCGTGQFNPGGIIPRPDPGESGNSSWIVAVPTFGGIRVTWNMPSVNPQGVAYTRVYRSSNTDFNSATEIASVGGNTYYDQMTNPDDVVLYYWIQVVTSAGRAWDPVGPAKAERKAFVEDLIDNLTKEIDEGMLSQSLQQEIQKITLNKQDLDSEIAKRIASDAALSEAFARVQQGLDESIALIHTTQTTWEEGQQAFAQELRTIAAVNQSNSAAILTEQSARVAADLAESKRTDQLLAANTAGWQAAIQTEQTARVTGDQANASQINTVQTSLGNQIASVETTSATRINALTGRVDAIWEAKVDVNGYVGGFGLTNNGRTIEAGFDVDRFWVGRANLKRKPFIIDGGTVYIDEAMIRRLTFDKLYSSDGTLVFENGVLKAKHLYVETLSIANNAITSVDSVNWNTNISGHGAKQNSNYIYLSTEVPSKVIVNFTCSGNVSGVNLSGGDTYINYTNLHTVQVELLRDGWQVYSRVIPCWSGFDANTGLSQGTYVPIAISYRDTISPGTTNYMVRITIRNQAGYPVNYKDVLGHLNAMAYKR